MHRVSSYHFVSGIDASSQASVAAYLTGLTAFVPHPESTLFNVNKGFFLSRAVYAGYNLFTQADVRVTIDVPGGVHSETAGSEPGTTRYPCHFSEFI